MLWSARIAVLFECWSRWAFVAWVATRVLWLGQGSVMGSQAIPVNLVHVLPSFVLLVPPLPDHASVNRDWSFLCGFCCGSGSVFRLILPLAFVFVPDKVVELAVDAELSDLFVFGPDTGSHEAIDGLPAAAIPEHVLAFVLAARIARLASITVDLLSL